MTETPQIASPFPALVTALEPFSGPFDAYRLAADGCEVLFASYPAGTEIARHDHDTHNVGLITVGELILITDDGEQRFGPGDWYELAPNQPHAARFEVFTAEIEFWFSQPPSADKT